MIDGDDIGLEGETRREQTTMRLEPTHISE